MTAANVRGRPYFAAALAVPMVAVALLAFEVAPRAADVWAAREAVRANENLLEDAASSGRGVEAARAEESRLVREGAALVQEVPSGGRLSSVLTLLDVNARDRGLEITRVAPAPGEAEGQVELTIETAGGFGATVEFLDAIERSGYPLRVRETRLVTTPPLGGPVRTTMTLEVATLEALGGSPLPR